MLGKLNKAVMQRYIIILPAEKRLFSLRLVL